ncbi:hypothetical protein [Vibrio sp. S234-5]|uniref:hypothetical protein n=1 Tax=Vibrio sp. S234-5 TaxID=1616781 RepID=UPI000AD29025|nr:hypothetical protein [Vibrio sp. S234-5]
MFSSEKVKWTTEELKPNPRNALGKEEITGKLDELLGLKFTKNYVEEANNQVRKTHLGAKEFQNQRSHTKEINKHTTSRKQTSVSSTASRTVPLARYMEKC